MIKQLEVVDYPSTQQRQTLNSRLWNLGRIIIKIWSASVCVDEKYKASIKCGCPNRLRSSDIKEISV